jgi:outer membrane biosynthesis protein TonB
MMYGGDIDWDVSLHDFADFHGKQIARRLTAQSKGGPQLTAEITLLEDLSAADSKLFAIHKATPAKKQLRVVVVPELELRKLSLDTPAPHWPDMATGKTSGAMVMRIVVDREGYVRSVDDFFSDNPALQQAAQEQIIKWRFKPYLDHGIPVQVISTLTFPFGVNQAAAAAVPAKP